MRTALLHARGVFQRTGDSEALIALGWVLRTRRALDEMLATGVMAIDRLPRHEEALVAVDQAIQLDPHYIDAWYQKGQILKTQERYEEALAAFDAAIRLNPQNSDAH
jgi:tetratricopeptide (TPR) repeat protein